MEKYADKYTKVKPEKRKDIQRSSSSKFTIRMVNGNKKAKYYNTRSQEKDLN